ncbi:MAG: hypothetical protein N2322_04020, partial [Terrimicrobiaceae bacterium]|nr:hypothetical protein [Terrimicrobiaceae bacterium]
MCIRDSASVERGGSAVIRLKAGGRTPGPIEFLIRSQPAHGRLTQPRRVSRSEAEVIYFHSGKGGSSDSFRFAVQAADSPVSVAQEAIIAIVDAPARIEAGPPLDFGTLAPGESRSLDSLWTNRGGTAARLKVAAKPPFKAQDGMLIAPGATLRVPVVFSPASPGDFEAELRAEGFPEAALPVFGSARKPIEITADQPLEFKEGRLRLGLRNLSDAPLHLEISHPGGQFPEAPALAPGEAISLELRRPEDFPGPSLPIRIQAGNFTETLEAAAGEASPELQGPQRLDFGKIEAASSASLVMTVRNTGRAEARLRAECPRELRVIPDPSSIVLPAGASRDFEAILEPSKAGRIVSTLRLEAGEAAPLEIPILADVFDPGETLAPAGATPPRIPTRELAASLQAPPSHNQPVVNPALPAPANIRQIPSPPHHLILSWTASSEPAARYVVEARAIRPSANEGPPVIEWNTWPRARFEKRGEEIIATLPGALPHSLWFLRVRALDSQGRSSPPSPTFQVSAPGHPAPWGFALAALAAVAAAVFAWKTLASKKRKHRENEARRLARLEGEASRS